MEPIMLQLEAQLEADPESRIIRGRILPFNTIAEDRGIRFAPGALQPRTPLKRVKMLRDHDHTQPLGYMVEFDQGEDYATAAFKIAEGEDGDRALREADAGLRDGLSVGVMPRMDGLRYIEDEDVLEVTAAELYETSVCAIPAFQDAQVDHIAAALDTARNTFRNRTNHQEESTMDQDQQTPPAAPAAPPAQQFAGPAVPPAPAGFTAAPSPRRTELSALRQRIAETRNIQAALDPIIQADVFDEVTVPAFVGELWAGRGYRERFTPLTASRPLTAQKMTGWRWVPGKTPDVGAYAGSLAEVPTNEVQAESVPFEAGRIASGHKVDRIHVDIPNPAFWESFYRERATNYAKFRDAKVLTHLLDPLNSTAKTVAAGKDGWGKLFHGALWVLEFATPDWAIIGADLYEQMASTADADKFAFLNAQLGLEEGTLAGFKIIPAPISRADLNGTVIVGATDATEHYELPGGPIRVEALDVAHGGVDAGLFGYDALFTTDARGVVKITEGV